MSGKLMTHEDLLRERQRLRAAGEVVVFTNGVFDLLHVGHVRYLAQARRLGDALIIAVNSDRAVRELKGNDRPIIDQDERAEVLGALMDVSNVKNFEEYSAGALREELLA